MRPKAKAAATVAENFMFVFTWRNMRTIEMVRQTSVGQGRDEEYIT